MVVNFRIGERIGILYGFCRSGVTHHPNQPEKFHAKCAKFLVRKSAQRSLLCKTFITIMSDKALFKQGKYHFGFINIDITKPYKTILAVIQESQFGVR